MVGRGPAGPCRQSRRPPPRPAQGGAAALAALALVFAACEPAAGHAAAAPAPPCEPTGEYTVGGSLDAVHGAVRVLVNGFPGWPAGDLDLVAMEAPGAGLGTPMTPALVSGRNDVAVEVVPAVRGPVGGGPVAGPARLRVWVCGPDGRVVPGTERGSDPALAAWRAELARRWPAWRAAEDSVLRADPALAADLAEALAADPGAAVMGRGPALDSARAWARANPVVVRTHFVRPSGPDGRPSDGEPSFDGVFRGGPVIGGTAADSARLRAYAVRLLALTAARDTAALVAELAPAVNGEFETHGSGTPYTRETWAEAARGGVVFADPEPYEAGDVELTSWSGGRVWELSRGPGEPLFASAWSGGGRSEMRAFVAEVGGRLRVVRR